MRRANHAADQERKTMTTTAPVFKVYPGFEERVRESFARLALMDTIGARLTRIAPGEVDIDMPVRDDLTQQHGFVAAAIVTAIVDTACGYAAMSLMPVGADVVTVEYKVNFVSPARGERLVARGRVVKPGRALTVCTGEVYALSGPEEKPVAAMLGTMMALPDRPEVGARRSIRDDDTNVGPRNDWVEKDAEDRASHPRRSPHGGSGQEKESHGTANRSKG